jgi:hypothetical protein
MGGHHINLLKMHEKEIIWLLFWCWTRVIDEAVRALYDW